MRCAPRAAHERASSARAMVPRHHFESELHAGRARRKRDLPILGRDSVNTAHRCRRATRLELSCQALPPGSRRIVRLAIVRCAVCDIFANITTRRTPIASRLDAILPGRMTVPARWRALRLSSAF